MRHERIEGLSIHADDSPYRSISREGFEIFIDHRTNTIGIIKTELNYNLMQRQLVQVY